MSSTFKTLALLLFLVGIACDGPSGPPGPPGSVGYRAYAAVISQHGEDSPRANVVQNTLGITINWSRESKGHYVGRLSQPIDTARSLVFATGMVPNVLSVVAGMSNRTEIRYAVLTGVNDYSDGHEGLSIELRVYN